MPGTRTLNKAAKAANGPTMDQLIDIATRFYVTGESQIAIAVSFRENIHPGVRIWLVLGDGDQHGSVNGGDHFLPRGSSTGPRNSANH